MKELSIEEKAKAYDELKVKAKDFSFKGYIDEECIYDMFPELADSDDEYFLRYIIACCKDTIESEDKGLELSMDTTKRLFAWLEKQGEQEKLNTYIDKLASDTIYNDENGNPIDKDLMSFASKVAFSMIPATKTESYHHLNRCRISDAVKLGAKWQKEKDESATKDFGDYITELSKQFPEVSFAKLSRIAVRVAKWQMAQMMANAIDVEVKVDAGGYPYIPQMELYDYDKDVPLAKEGDKYNVVLIKEE